MAIDYRALRSITAREIIAALLRDGFFFIASTAKGATSVISTPTAGALR